MKQANEGIRKEENGIGAKWSQKLVVKVGAILAGFILYQILMGPNPFWGTLIFSVILMLRIVCFKG